MELLVLLLRDPEREVAAAASRTLDGWTEADISLLLKSPDCSGPVFLHFSASASPTLCESIVLNPAAPNEAIAAIAGHTSSDLAEAILYNRQRLLDCPDILYRLNSNPNLNDRLRAQIREIEAEHSGAGKQSYSTRAGESQDLAPNAETPYVEGGLWDEKLALDSIPSELAAGEGTIFERLARMSVPQKIRCALHGTREVRALLIRDPTKDVARSVLKSPKLTEAEVVAFSAMRNISDDILRLIAGSKEWTASYNVVFNLVKNPKTPVYISQKMLARLHRRDLVLLSNDRGIPEAIRRNAQRLAKQRSGGG